MTKRGIMMIGHGSRLAYNKSAMEMQADLLRKEGYGNVCIGFNEMSRPSIEESLEQMTDDGVDEIVALPFFIASGQHTLVDIPGKLGLPAGYGSGIVSVNGGKVTIHYESPFGEDPHLSDILVERMQGSDHMKERTGIMVIGHGSKLRYNSEIVRLNAERIVQKGYPNVHVGFNEHNEPRIEDAIEQMLKDGMDSIVVLPLFIASGAHLAEEIPEKLGIPPNSNGGTVRCNGRNVNIVYADPVGVDPRLCDVILRKIRKYY